MAKILGSITTYLGDESRYSGTCMIAARGRLRPVEVLLSALAQDVGLVPRELDKSDENGMSAVEKDEKS